MPVIAVNFELGKPLFPGGVYTGTIYALRAEIHKSFLNGIDLEKLNYLYPNRISVINEMVNLTGPVIIVPKIHQIPDAIGNSLALAVLGLGVFAIIDATYKLIPLNINRKVEFKTGLALVAISGLLTTIFTINNYLAVLNDPGIYFYDFSYKIPFLCPAAPQLPFQRAINYFL